MLLLIIIGFYLYCLNALVDALATRDVYFDDKEVNINYIAFTKHIEFRR